MEAESESKKSLTVRILTVHLFFGMAFKKFKFLDYHKTYTCLKTSIIAQAPNFFLIKQNQPKSHISLAGKDGHTIGARHPDPIALSQVLLATHLIRLRPIAEISHFESLTIRHITGEATRR